MLIVGYFDILGRTFKLQISTSTDLCGANKVIMMPVQTFQDVLHSVNITDDPAPVPAHKTI